MHVKPSVGLALALLTVGGMAAVPAQAQNLVTNPGFETGDFSGWTTTFAGGGNSNLSVSPYDTRFGVPPHSGTYDARFGANIDGDSISQSLPTVAGDSYTITFFLRNVTDGSTTNDFQAYFGGNQLLNLFDASLPSYTQFSYTATAATTSTALKFAGTYPPGYYYLDDISVTDAAPAVPEASSFVSLGLLLALGAGGLVVSRRRKAGAVR